MIARASLVVTIAHDRTCPALGLVWGYGTRLCECGASENAWRVYDQAVRELGDRIPIRVAELEDPPRPMRVSAPITNPPG